MRSVVKALSVALGGLLGACSPRAASPTTVALSTLPTPEPVLRVVGDELRDGRGEPVWLRGIAFGNRVWQDDPLPDEHHGELDFQRVALLGMNSVRFYLNYRTLEDDATPGRYREEGFAWIDRNVAWARSHGLKLVLNLHVPPGGDQSLGGGHALWFDPALQQRFIDLWRALAARYRGEAAVAGFDLLNEPVVPRWRAEWHRLAERTVAAIRSVDPDHVIFVERVNAVGGDWSEDRARNLFLVDDPNVVYEFHFYKPFHFTHQGAPWVDFVAIDQRYPNPAQVGVEWFQLQTGAASHASPKLFVGDSDWAYYQGAPLRVDDDSLVVGNVVLVVNANSGRAHFDELLVEELDAEGRVKREVMRLPLDRRAGWYFHRKDGSGRVEEAATGHGDGGSLVVSGTRGQASLSADVHRFRLESGAIYRASGWMRGEQIPDGATCQIRLELLRSAVPVPAVDRTFLAQELDAYLAFGRAQEVPLYLGEFGAIRGSFDADRGGERWVTDMLELLAERRLGFAYHAYHEEHFGLYSGEGTLPSDGNVNEALQAALQAGLGAQTEGATTAAPSDAPALPRALGD